MSVSPATTDTPYTPRLYDVDGYAQPLPGLDAVGPEQVAFYHEHGYLAVEGVFEPDEVATITQALMDLIDGKTEGYDGVQPEAVVADRFNTLDAQARADAVRKLWNLVPFSPTLRALADDARLTGMFERLTGKQPRLFQDMALLKPPRQGREKPWHQDHAYFNLPIGTPIVGMWIALDDATLDNGCMHVLDGGHRDGPVIHFQRRDWQICDTDMLARRRPCIAAPLKPGGTLFFDGMLPHGTPANRSDHRRRAVQLHYIPADAIKIPEADRLAVFGSEGKDVTC